MSIHFIFRIIGMIFFGFIGGYIGNKFSLENVPEQVQNYTVGFTLLGFLIGLIGTPYISTFPMSYLKKLFSRISAETLLAGFVGLLAGLLIAALLTFPLSLLPTPFGKVLPLLAVIISAYIGITLLIMRQNDIFYVLRNFYKTTEQSNAEADSWIKSSRSILLDTSVIIDGRVSDIAKTGFLPGTMIIPRFVLTELQFIADSSESLRRQRGRRGMAVLTELQKNPLIMVQISDIDVEGVKEVDDKLVILAKQLRCPVLTNDYNLNRIAELQGVSILNINELANSVKSIVLPGEILEIAIIQDGKEHNQGVGYMEDGTMVVVDGGNKYIGTTKLIGVTKVLQTAAGKMIFGKPESEEQ
jgi:uncharacterized protein YacL